jgi:hypothetical protein
LGKLTQNKSLSFFLPVILAIIIFFIVRPFVAQAVEGEVQSVELGEVIVEADKEKNSQVYLVEDGQKKQLSEAGVPSTEEDSGDRYVVWMSQHEANWQVHAYDFRQDRKFQLTFVGNNVRPQTTGQFIVWEGQQDGIWSIFLFDGVQVSEISQGEQPVQELILERNLLTFLQKDVSEKGWKGFYYDLAERKLNSISENQLISELKIHRGVISWRNADNTFGQIFTANVMYFPTPVPVIPPIVATIEEEEELVDEPTQTPEASASSIPIVTPTLTEEATAAASTISTATPTVTFSPTATPVEIIEETSVSTDSGTP